MGAWEGRRVLITGACGTVGGEILRQLVDEGPAAIVAVDNNESELFFVEQAYRPRHPGFRVALADVRDAPSLTRLMDGVDVVLHAAALKHVHLCEQSPRQAVLTNIVGVQNVIDAAYANRVERVVFTSSDKAVNPTSVMGTSKLMGERLFTAADLRHRGKEPIFASTRFGNVLGSRGSVIPLFHRQIQAGGPVTLTDPDMTRFIMTLEEAVRLVMDSVFLARGGEVFVTKMPVVRIQDLAEVMVEELAPEYGHDPADVAVQVVGSRPGEKLYEELLNEEEVRRAVEYDRYFIVNPAVPPVPDEPVQPSLPEGAVPVTRAYNSAGETPMSREELRAYLRSHGLLAPVDATAGSRPAPAAPKGGGGA